MASSTELPAEPPPSVDGDLRLAVNMQLDFMEEVRQAQKVRCPERLIPILDIAVRDYEEQLYTHYTAYVNDQNIDRHLARTIADLEAQWASDLDNEVIGRTKAAEEVTGRDDVPTPVERCVSCQEDNTVIADLTPVPCGHKYCQACLERLFEMSMTDETLFPPECCVVPIPLGPNLQFLTPEFVERFKARGVELATRDRTYCSNHSCSAFIDPKKIQRGVAGCVLCGTFTCTTCKAKAHGGDCSEDPSLEQTITMATENGWQRCYLCRRIVELDHGCNRIK